MKRSRKSRGEDQETDNDTRNCTACLRAENSEDVRLQASLEFMFWPSIKHWPKSLRRYLKRIRCQSNLKRVYCWRS